MLGAGVSGLPFTFSILFFIHITWNRTVSTRRTECLQSYLIICFLIFVQSKLVGVLKRKVEEKTCSVSPAFLSPAQLSGYNPTTFSLPMPWPSKTNPWSLQMVHTDPNPVWTFPVFLNHAEKTVQQDSFKDICLLCLETKKNKPNPSLQINSSKLKACGKVY